MAGGIGATGLEGAGGVFVATGGTVPTPVPPDTPVPPVIPVAGVTGATGLGGAGGVFVATGGTVSTPVPPDTPVPPVIPVAGGTGATGLEGAGGVFVATGGGGATGLGCVVTVTVVFVGVGCGGSGISPPPFVQRHAPTAAAIMKTAAIKDHGRRGPRFFFPANASANATQSGKRVGGCFARAFASARRDVLGSSGGISGGSWVTDRRITAGSFVSNALAKGTLPETSS